LPYGARAKRLGLRRKRRSTHGILSARAAKGDLDAALNDCAEAIRLKPDDAEAYYNRGAARRDKGDSASAKAAIADFQKYLDLGGGIRDGDQAAVEQFIRDLKNKP
jgi:tetratricopeptide (TPR) repeat protein